MAYLKAETTALYMKKWQGNIFMRACCFPWGNYEGKCRNFIYEPVFMHTGKDNAEKMNTVLSNALKYGGR